MATDNPTVEELEAAQSSVMETEQADCVNTSNIAEPVANVTVPQLEPSFAMPSQQLQSFDSIFSLGGQEFFLNNCGTKRLVIGITSEAMPKLKVVFKLHDLKNGWSINFSKKTWDTIIAFEAEISSNLRNFIVDEVFDNNRIRVETTILYNTCCVQFYDVTLTSVTMMPPTFERMVSLKDEVENIYKELINKKNDVAKRIKLFMDVSFFYLFKSNNIDSRHSYNYLTLFMNQSSNFMELSHSIANTWDQLGKWTASENQPDPENEP